MAHASTWAAWNLHRNEWTRSANMAHALSVKRRRRERMSRHGFDSKQKRCYDSRSHCMQHTVRSAKITHIDTIGLGLGEIAIIGGGYVGGLGPCPSGTQWHLPAGNTLVQLLAMYTPTLRATVNSVTDRQTDRQTEDIIRRQ